MGQHIKANREIIKDMVGASRYTKMDHTIKDSGEMICLMEEEFLYRPMVANTKASSRIKNVQETADMFQQMVGFYMKANFKMICNMGLELKLKLANISIQEASNTLSKME